eukprot:6846011-Pyramimonas_sp.AAC.1
MIRAVFGRDRLAEEDLDLTPGPRTRGQGGLGNRVLENSPVSLAATVVARGVSWDHLMEYAKMLAAASELAIKFPPTV